MTTAGFVSGTRDDEAPTCCSRVAAVASVLLGLVLVAALPATYAAAFYLAVLAGVSAVVTIVAGYVLWSRASLLVRSAAALAAGGTLVAQVLQVSLGLPGAGGLSSLTVLETGIVLGLPGAVLLFLLADALRRRPEQAPDHPYAL
ncbi:MAG TPA: hypothetical protein VK964_17395 [Nocardioidaceae bacterium]|nr:hypothetical protein [Nocardioidaceae bacterium]